MPAPVAAPSVAAPPVRLDIPAIGVHSALQPLGLAADGSLQSPDQWDRAGWYANGVHPGDLGPAVIAGHVDSAADGPAVFFRLGELRPGTPVLVTLSTGAVVHFVVDTTQSFPKRDFPTELVYGPTPLAELRLITCGGGFDARAHSYLDNVIVTAHLV